MRSRNFFVMLWNSVWDVSPWIAIIGLIALVVGVIKFVIGFFTPHTYVEETPEEKAEKERLAKREKERDDAIEAAIITWGLLKNEQAEAEHQAQLEEEQDDDDLPFQF